jgi:hypothetical protein
MTRPLASISIDGYYLKSTSFNYRRWQFKRKDRLVRNLRAPEYLYVTSASVLRERLAQAGYDRATLELEFLRYMQTVFASYDRLPYFFNDNFYYGVFSPSQRAQAYRLATLDDWLFALKEIIVNGWHSANTPPTTVASSCNYMDVNILVDIIACDSLAFGGPVKPDHALKSFPCVSLECMAVAMLEVVADDAECVLDVTQIVENNLAYSFDDLILALKMEKEMAPEALGEV